MIRWTLILVAVFYVLPSILTALRRRRSDPIGTPSTASQMKVGGIRLLILQLLVFTFVVLTHGLGWWTLGEVGAQPTVDSGVGFVVGAMAFALFYFVFLYRLFLRGEIDAQEEHINRFAAAIWPTRKSQKIPAFIALVILNPINEELLFRGVLVELWAQQLGSVWPPVVIGLILHLFAHAYQGLGAVLGFVLMYGVFVGLLFSPLGLWGAIGAHVMADLLPIALMRPRPAE